jgi:hypothetical protein
MDPTLEAVLRFQHGQVTAPFKPVIPAGTREAPVPEDNGQKEKEKEKEKG